MEVDDKDEAIRDMGIWGIIEGDGGRMKDERKMGEMEMVRTKER